MINKHCVGHYVIVKSTIDKKMIDKAIKLFDLHEATVLESPLNQVKEGSMNKTGAGWRILYVDLQGKLNYRDSIDSYMIQRSFKELDIKTNLQTINSPFGELDKQTKKELLCAWVDGAEFEVCGRDEWNPITDPSWSFGCTYRVKPIISAKEAAKAKLISEAQQQLRDAQEALDKAQQL